MGRTAKNEFTDKENLFIECYLANGFNGKEAVIEAGYSPNTASAAACKILAKPKIKKEIAKRLKSLNKGKVVCQEDVLVNLYYAITRTAEDFVDENGRLLNDVNRMNPRARACIDGIKQKVTVLKDPETGEEMGEKIETEIKISPKLPALELAMKHKGMFPAIKHNHSGEVNHKHQLDWDQALSRGDRDLEDVVETKLIEENNDNIIYLEDPSEEEVLYEKR